MRRVWVASGIALGIAAAILGCVSPVMTILMDNAGPADSSALSPWRSYLPIVAFALLGLAFLFTYRAARLADREPGSIHGRPAFVAWRWRVVWIATAVVVASASFSYYAPRLMRAVGRAPYVDGRIGHKSTVRVVLTIEGLDCPVCAGGLQNNLRQIPGVRQAEVSFQEKQATVEYDPKAVEPTRLAQAVAQAGFKVVGAISRID